MTILSLPDLDLFYERHGAGPRVLLCNGSGATIATTGPLVQLLAQQCEVLVHDQRGLGRTGVPATQATMADYASDAVALLDHVGWDTAAVFGISFGGMVAQELAVTVPDRIERLALLCTSAGGAGGSSFPLHQLAAMDPVERARVAMHNLDTRFDSEWLADHPSDRALLEAMSARRNQPVDAEQARGEAMQLEARRHHDVWDRLHRITCPTLVQCGEYDGLAPVSNSEAICSRILGAELRTYQGGHLFVSQDRAAAGDVLAFLCAGNPLHDAPLCP
ncbi:MAG: alpha/beta hydrolase [Ilumatobacteraceae bacterium]